MSATATPTSEMLESQSAFYGAEETEQMDFSNVDRGDDFAGDEPEQEEAAEVEEPVEETPEEAEEATEPEEEEAPEPEQITEEEASTETAPSEEAPVAEEKARSKAIPRDRFDQVNDKLAAAKARIKELEEARTRDVPNQEKIAQEKAEREQSHNEEVAKLMAQANDLLLDGKTDDAVKVQMEALKLQQDRATEVAREEAMRDADIRVAQNAFDAKLATLETEYPFLNPDNQETYDQALVTRVSSLKDALARSEGMSQAEALEEAVETVAARFNIASTSSLQREDTAVEQETAEALAARKAQVKQAEVARKTNIAAKQPARIGGSSAAETERARPAPAQMTDAEFSQISAEELQRLRGDFIE